MTGGVITVTGHVLLVAQLGTQTGFDLAPADDETGLYLLVNRTRDAFAISTRTSDGPVRVDTAEQPPPAGRWPEQATAPLNIAGPMLAVHMVDEEELDPLFVPDKPGPHTVTVYGDRTQGSPERYLMMFTAST